MDETRFEWDEEKARENLRKHKVSFQLAQQAFIDPKCVMARDLKHGSEKERFYCIGKVGDGILTVRFTYRGQVIRIIGAGYWRKGRKVYEEKDSLHG